jgi:hypothetical protein
MPGRLRANPGGLTTQENLMSQTMECRCRNPFGEVGTGEEEVLDVRELAPEGQIGRTLERMEVLPDGSRLRHINTLIQWPLLAMLEGRGHRYRLVGRKDGAVHIVIWGNTPAR